MAVPGVKRAQATWELVENVPTIVVTVLLGSGRAAELDAIRQVLIHTDRCRGARRHPLLVRAGAFEYVFLDAVFAGDSHLPPEGITSAVVNALDQLFASSTRRFGESEWVSRIEAVIQNTDGVQWAKVRGFGSLGTADKPETLALPAAPWPLVTRLDCSSDRILSLFHTNTTQGPVKLTIAAVPPGECDV